MFDSIPQISIVIDTLSAWFSPVIAPVIGVVLFIIIARLILGRLVRPSAAGGPVGLVASFIDKKKLIALLFSAVGAFLGWFALQPPEFQEGIMSPIQAITGLVVSDQALFTLVKTLFGIAVVVLFL